MCLYHLCKIITYLQLNQGFQKIQTKINKKGLLEFITNQIGFHFVIAIFRSGFFFCLRAGAGRVNYHLIKLML